MNMLSLPLLPRCCDECVSLLSEGAGSAMVEALYPPLGGSASHMGARLPTVWSFSAFSLGRERMKGQEEGGLEAEEEGLLPAPGRPLGGHSSPPQQRVRAQAGGPGLLGPPAHSGGGAMARAAGGRPPMA